ncbi:MAG: hypothetical protein KKG09_07205 [Verrucomicrobia bacterium]|nr:hypothetical protein [Verrucomicrobiota bacterium]MBU4291718.1 hypothetical protein [Verrucomicrobiota bacterium]MBU4497772.1 hypothetical protein [Verrucomicrobiota bacterium]MCG2681583.1 hypothetical protein [Kiritimatiellia bacterium]
MSTLKRGSIFLLGMAIWFSGAGACFAADDYWTNAVDGDFSVGANWTDGTAPGSADIAYFNKNAGSPYTVTFDVAITNSAFRVRTDRVAFNLNGLTNTALSASIGTSSGDNGWLWLSNGTVHVTNIFNLGEVSGATGTLVVAAGGPVTIRPPAGISEWRNYVHVGRAGYGRLIVTNGGYLTIANKSLYIASDTADGEGHVIVSGAGSVLQAYSPCVGYNASEAAKTSTLEVLNGGVVGCSGNFNVYDQIIVDGPNSVLTSSSRCFLYGPGAGADVRVRNGGRFIFLSDQFFLGGDKKGSFAVTDGGSAYLSCNGDGLWIGGFSTSQSGQGGFMTIGTNSVVTHGSAASTVRIWTNSTVTLNDGTLQFGATPIDLRGTVTGSGTIGSTSTVVSINSTGLLVPGGTNSAGTLIVTNANLVFTNSLAGTTNGTLFLEFSESVHDMVILPNINRSINLANAKLSYSLISGSSFRPRTPVFMDFLIATNITGAVFSDNMTSLLNAVTPSFVQYTYGIVTVGASDYGGLYSGYKALRLTASMSAGTVVSFH